jgi:hypothetical protein
MPACSLRQNPGAPVIDSETWAPDVDAATTNQQSGCGLIMTEFTSADGLSRMRESKRKRYLTYYDDEHPISAQLFGSNPETPRGLGAHRGGRGLRPRRPQPRLPGQARRRVQRRLRPAARPAADRGIFRAVRAAVTRFPSPSSSAWAGTTRTSSASSLAKSLRRTAG